MPEVQKLIFKIRVPVQSDQTVSVEDENSVTDESLKGDLSPKQVTVDDIFGDDSPAIDAADEFKANSPANSKRETD